MEENAKTLVDMGFALRKIFINYFVCVLVVLVFFYLPKIVLICSLLLHGFCWYVVALRKIFRYFFVCVVLFFVFCFKKYLHILFVFYFALIKILPI